MTRGQRVYGFHGVTALMRHRADDIIRVYYDADRIDARMKRFLAEAEAQQLPLTAADARRLDQMVGNATHQGIVAEVRPKQSLSLTDLLKQADPTEKPIVMLLDGVTDPHNLGACFRVADAFGVSAIVAPKDNSVGVNATVVKSASGATETVPFITVTNLVRAIEQLKAAGFWVFGADAGDEASRLDGFDLTGPTAWIFGAEGTGMRALTRRHCDYLVIIPMAGAVESLNISVAAGICLYETRRQRGF